MKLYIAVLLFCLAQIQGQDLRLTPEEEKAQYGVVKYAAEATIFRMRAYSIALEMNYSVKKINQEIIAKMVELGIAEENVNDLKTEMTEKAESINDNLLRIMEYCATLITTLETTNADIMTSSPDLNLDLAKIISDTSGVNLTYDIGSENIEQSIEIIKLMIKIEIAGNDDPIAEEINGLMTEAETILNTEYSAMVSAKEIFDIAADYAITSLEELLSPTTTTPSDPPNTTPAPPNKY